MTKQQKHITNQDRMETSDQRKTVGLHAIVECTGGISHLDCEQLECLLRDAADAAGATVLGSHFHAFGEGFGNTGVLILAESHISVHTWPENDYAAIDLFICGDGGRDSMEPVEAAIDVLRSADRHGRLFFHVVQRAAPLKSAAESAQTAIDRSGGIGAAYPEQ